jgi:hypothetical protein
MQSTQSVQSWLGTLAAVPRTNEPQTDERRAEAPERQRPEHARPGHTRPDHERDARDELTRLRVEIEQLVQAEGDTARSVVDSALESVTRMQIATANLDACRPPPASFVGSALVALADAHLRGHSDAIERGMAYTADNQIRLLLPER